MRGSPLIRFLFVVVALVATGIGLSRVTASKPVVKTSQPVATAKTSTAVPFHLQLSSPAAAVEISTGISKITSLSGTLQLDDANPQVFLTVKWQTPPAPGELRFAKLTLEPSGQATLTHTFDARGDIDDLFELPVTSGK